MNEPLPSGSHMQPVPKVLTTSVDAMCHHSQLCKPALASVNDDNDQEEESNSDDNGEDDFAFSYD